MTTILMVYVLVTASNLQPYKKTAQFERFFIQFRYLSLSFIVNALNAASLTANSHYH